MEEAKPVSAGHHKNQSSYIYTPRPPQTFDDLSACTNAILESIDKPILVLNHLLQVKTASRQFCDQLGTTRTELEDQYFPELKNCPWNNTGLCEMLSDILIDKSPYTDFEISCYLPDQGEKVFKINARYQESSQGSLLVLAIDDITNHLQEKDQLIINNAALEESIRLAVESADIGTWELDPSNEMISWDKRCQHLFSIAKNHVSYNEFLNALHPGDRHKTVEVIQQVLQGAFGGKFNIEYRTVGGQENDCRWLKSIGQVYFDQTGGAQKFAGTVTDITQQKLNEELLRESEARFRLASDAAAAMIWMTGTDKKFNYFNKSWLQYTGRTFEAEEGDGWSEGIHPEDYKKVIDVFDTSFRDRKSFQVEYRLRRWDDTYRWLCDSGSPRFSPDGIFEGYVGTCIDIHDQKMTQEELERLVKDRTKSLSDAIGHLEASNHNLEEFAYVASHDLQEPLRKIQTFANRLQEKKSDQLSDDTRLYLSKISKASVRMTRLISDLLNYAKLQRTDHAIETVDLNEVIRHVLNDFDYIIQDKRAVVHLDVLPVINAVPMRMGQLFHNLVSNALKFSRSGVTPIINISAKILPGSMLDQYSSLPKDKVYTMIRFSDNGIGFNEEFAEKIFNIFQRLNGVDEFEGTGIGLAICRKIVLSHHGLIFAESKENEGTLFRIILPVNHE